MAPDRIILETPSLPGVEPAHVHRTMARLAEGGLIYVVLSEVVPCTACYEHWSRGYWTRERAIRAERQLAREQVKRDRLIEEQQGLFDS